MGCRALIQIKNIHNATGNIDVSPCVYLHYHGHMVKEFAEELALKMISGKRTGDTSYAFARLVGICHDKIPGALSVGVWNQETELTAEDSHGDMGCFVINCTTWDVETHASPTAPFNAHPVADTKADIQAQKQATDEGRISPLTPAVFYDANDKKISVPLISLLTLVSGLRLFLKCGEDVFQAENAARKTLSVGPDWPIQEIYEHLSICLASTNVFYGISLSPSCVEALELGIEQGRDVPPRSDWRIAA